MKKLSAFVLLFIFGLAAQAQNNQGSHCSNPRYIYPNTSCVTTTAASNCAVQATYPCPTSGCNGTVSMVGTTSSDPVCTPDDETQQGVYWIAVTATTNTFTINNQVAYTGTGITPASPENVKDYVVYSGACGSLTQIACGTLDATGFATGQLTVSGVTAGQVYLVMASPSAGAPAADLLRFCITAPVAYQSPNNSCVNALPIFLNSAVPGTTAGACPNGPLCSGSIENVVWYKWCAPITLAPNTQVFFNLFGGGSGNGPICVGGQGMQYSVWNTNNTCPTSASSPTVLCNGSANTSCGTAINISFLATSGNCYYISLDGFAGASCTFEVMLTTSIASGGIGPTCSSVCPPPVISGSGIICAGDPLTLSGSVSGQSGAAFQWTGPNNFSASTASISFPNATSALNGIYTLTSTSSVCPTPISSSILVQVNTPPPAPTALPVTVCSPGVATLSASGSPHTYNWSDNPLGTTVLGTNSVYTTGNLLPGTHNFYVQSVSPGCPPSAAVAVPLTVLQSPALTIWPAQAAVCPGQTVQLSAAGADTYSWGPAATISPATGATVTASPVSTTTYIVTGTTGSCTTTDSVEITVTPVPVVNVTASAPIVCTGSVLTLTATGANTYSWAAGNGLAAQTGNAALATPAVAGVHTYTVTGFINSCSASDTVAVTVNQTPVLSASGATACAGDSVSLVVTGPAGTAYSWSGPNGFTSTDQNPTVLTALGASTFSVTGTLNGCSDSVTVALTGIALPTVSAVAAPDSIAPGQLLTLFIPNPDPTLTYTWSGPSLNQTTGDTVTANPTTTGTITYTVTASNGTCSATATVTVEVDPAFLIQISNWNWAYTAGGTGGRFTANSTPGFGRQFLTGEAGIDIAADAAGNTTTLGRFVGSATFGTATLSSSGPEDLVLIRTNSSGNLQWVQQLGSAATEEPRAVAMDAAGNAYVTGNYTGTMAFSTILLPAATAEKMFVACYANSGSVLWAKTTGGSGRAVATGIAVNAQGVATVSGYFYGTVSFDNITLTGSATVPTGFVARYQANGNAYWAMALESTQGCTVSSIGLDISGNCYLTGTYSGTTAFFSLSSPGSWGRYVAKLDYNGYAAYARTNGTAADMADGAVLSTTPEGHFYVTGTFSGTDSFGNSTYSLTSQGGTDVFLLFYTRDGYIQWARRAGGTGNDEAGSVVANGQGLCFIAGTYRGYARFGSHGLSAIGGTDVFVAKYDMGGNCLWARKAGSIADDAAAAVAVDAQGNSYVTGSYRLTATFGLSNMLTAVGQQDIFVAKLEHIQVLGTEPVLAGAHQLMVFPNPFSTGFTVAIPAGSGGKAQVLLLDMLGRQLYNRSFDAGAGETALEVQPEQELPQGVYLLQVRQGETVYTTRLVKQ